MSFFQGLQKLANDVSTNVSDSLERSRAAVYSTEDLQPGDEGYRRKKLSTIAGQVYRASASAVGDIKESYNQSRLTSRHMSGGPKEDTIPQSFPSAEIISSHGQQMVLFRTYGKAHNKTTLRAADTLSALDEYGVPIKRTESTASTSLTDELAFDPNAIVDVDVRGWLYTPQTEFTLTRRNRLTLSIARQLVGIPMRSASTPTIPESGTNNGMGKVEEAEEEDDAEMWMAAQRASEIERLGQAEQHIASYGDYTDPKRPGAAAVEPGLLRPLGKQPTLSPTTYSNENTYNLDGPSYPASNSGNKNSSHNNSTSSLAVAPTDPEAMMAANETLLARLSPFLTTPLAGIPVTVFLFTDTRSVSRTVVTTESGHFSLRAALDFKPTGIKVLATEYLSAVRPVAYIPSEGVSVISDIDDTIKRSDIASGAREVFRNTFVRDLDQLLVPGVHKWYQAMAKEQVHFHYCSNSPWHLYPMLVTFLQDYARLPISSIHLKQYDTKLQGIFEPVAERKKGTLERLVRDFPLRRYILIGDSNEADLEVYTELALQHPSNILGIFIRDIISQKPSYSGENETFSLPSSGTILPTKPSITTTTRSSPSRPVYSSSPSPSKASGEVEEDLIDLREPLSTVPEAPQKPPRPAKPVALRGEKTALSPASGTAPTVSPYSSKQSPLGTSPFASPSEKVSLETMSSTIPSKSSSSETASPISRSQEPPPPPKARRSMASSSGIPSTSILSESTPPKVPRKPVSSSSSFTPSSLPPSSSSSTTSSPLKPSSSFASANTPSAGQAPPPPLPRRAPPVRRTPSSISVSSTASTQSSSTTTTMSAAERKAELWQERVVRARAVLDPLGIRLFLWQHGEEAMAETQRLLSAYKRS